MKVGLIGFGKTGKAVATVLLQNDDFNLEWVIRRSTQLENRSVAEYLGVRSKSKGLIHSADEINLDEFLTNHPVDIIIDFSSNKGVYTYGELAAAKGIKIISAISHYSSKDLAFLQQLAEKTTVFWSANITLGINYILFAAKSLQRLAPNVDIEIVEEHFKQKAGVSGTAIKIADELKINKSNINSVRVGGIVGKHQVIFGFKYQTVRLIHESISREAFGNGVIFVARNIIDREKGFLNYDDILLPYFDINNPKVLM